MGKILKNMRLAKEVIECKDAQEWIKRALIKKVREHNPNDIKIGEEVYYKRNKDKKWKGPAKVIGK